jgi:hypothetical protein
MTTVKSCTEKKRVQGKNGGEAIIYNVTMTDGRVGESYAKQIPEGTPASDLEFEETQWGLKVKAKAKVNGFGGGKRAEKGNESFAMSYAKDLVVADKVKIDQLLPVADKIYNWMEDKKQKV